MRFRRSLLVLGASTAIVFGIYVLQQYLYQNEAEYQSNVFALSRQKSHPKLHVAVVACGQRLQETLVMIKSALLFNHPKNTLHFLIFVEDHEASLSFHEKLEDWRTLIPDAFDFSLLPLKFPAHREAEWRNLFKPCAAQRLFLPSILDDIDALLYVDTDIIFLSAVSDIWKFFHQFNATQIAALTPEHEDENVGWYNRFARHPYYGHLGVNSGVMLMNLTRMRMFKWEAHVLPIHNEYKLRITWGDQDIINILFYFHPETLYVMSCEYNFRPDHCMYMSVCNTSSVAGVKVLHGNRGYFHSNKQPLFKEIYEAVERYQLGTNPYTHFLQPLEASLGENSVSESNCGKISKDALFIARQVFLSDYSDGEQ